MPINNFKLFDENKANMMSDDDYAINQQRLNGVQSGVASSQLQNKTLYQTALMCYALAQLMAANGYDANDANSVSTFVNNMSQTMVQKVKDRASELEVKTGAKVNKYITPGDFMTALNYLTKAKYGESDPTTSTEGTLGQIYVNTTTQRAFYCGKIEGNTFTWNPIARVKKAMATEVITESTDWIVPDGVTQVSVMVFGGGGGGKAVDYAGTSMGGGGGSGYMRKEIVNVNASSIIPIVIGLGGSAGEDGGVSKFGENVTANGGSAGSANGGAGGAGGGGGSDDSTIHGSGGSGQYGGGGGGGSNSSNSSKRNGGNGGQYGGGGGGGATNNVTSSGGNGGQYGGNGGTVTSSSVGNAAAGTNTVGMGLEFEGTGAAGSKSSRAAGGGGGYGGNGGNASAYGGGGGGGYGANGGNGSKWQNERGGGGGGGGGYGGAGKTGSNGGGGGGGGYGRNNYGSGGSAGEKGSDGCVIITYEKLSVY